MATITINGQALEFDGDLSVLGAAKQLGVDIPTLCYNEHLSAYGGCRLCMVENLDIGKLVPACCTTATDGMNIETNSEECLSARRFVMGLILSRAPQNREMQELAREIGIEPDGDQQDPVTDYLLTRSAPREMTDCVLCSLCVRACAEVPQRDAISFKGRGFSRRVDTPFGTISEACIGCGSCVYVCPTNAITVEPAD